MLRDPVGLSLFLVSMAILLQHASGPVIRDAEHDRASTLLLVVLVFVKGMAGHCLKAAQRNV